MKVGVSFSRVLFPVLVFNLMGPLIIDNALANKSVSIPGSSKTGIAPFMAALEAGDYSFQQYDKGLIEQLRNDEHFKRNKADLDFLMNTRESLQNDFNRFMTNYVNNSEVGMAKMQADYLSGKHTRIEDFYTTAMGYKNAKELLIAKIDGINAMVSSLPSQVQQVAGTEAVPNYLNVSFEKLALTYKSLVNAADAMVRGSEKDGLKGMTFRIKFQDGIPRQIPAEKALAFEFENVPTISADERDKMRKRALSLKVLDDNEKNQAARFGQYLRKYIVRYIRQFGDRESYRWRNEQDLKAAEAAFERVQQAFWARSYLRAMYGMPLGVLTLREYPKQWGKIDRFLVSNNEMSIFVEGMTWNDGNLMDQAESLRNGLITIDQRAEKIFDGDGSFLAKLNSFITFAKGERPVAEALNRVYALMAADVAEEIMITSGGGEDQIINMYQARYYADKQTESYYFSLEDMHFPQGDDMRISTLSPGTLGYEVESLSVLAEKRQDRIGEARDLLALVKVEEMRAGAGEVREQINNRRNRLRAGSSN